MRGYGKVPEEWADSPITEDHLAQIRMRAHPKNGRTIGSLYELTLERDLRALLAELDRRGAVIADEAVVVYQR